VLRSGQSRDYLRRVHLPLSVLCLVLAAAPEPQTPPRKPFALRHHLVADGATTGALLAGWVGTETVFKTSLAPAACRWCATNPVDSWGRGLRAAPSQVNGFDTASGVVGFGLVTAAMLGADVWLAGSSGALEAAPVDVLIILESLAVALAVNQGVKFAVGRERPFVSALGEAEKAQTHQPSDNNLSFFSGHSTFAFTLVVATGTVAQLRGYENAWLVWAVGLPLATAVPLMRMAADKHYLTDVLVGSVFGAAVGCGLPVLLHGRVEEALPKGTHLMVLPSPGGLALGGMF
jgi:membrane-associated phospholipid phosphatase